MSRYRRCGRYVSLSIAGTCLAAFALATVAFTDDRQHLSSHLDNVDARNGIDVDESQSIARAYFEAYIGACGGPDDGKLVGRDWIIPASEGYAGTPLASPIRIDANSGAISYANGPSFPGYRTFRFMVLWGLPIYRLMRSVRESINETLAGEQ